MGVTVLLPQLREAMNTVQFKCLAGKRAGICGHGWLYALSMHSASRCLAGQYDQLIQAFLRRCETVREGGIMPVVCFDGESFPGKMVGTTRKGVLPQCSLYNTRAKVAKLPARPARGRLHHRRAPPAREMRAVI